MQHIESRPQHKLRAVGFLVAVVVATMMAAPAALADIDTYAGYPHATPSAMTAPAMAPTLPTGLLNIALC